MTVWSLDVLMEIKPKFSDCSKTANKKRGLNGGLEWVALGRFRNKQAGRKGAFTMAHMCTACHLFPKDDSVWFLTKNNSHWVIGLKSLGARTHCASCGSHSKAKDMSCLVSMQYGVSRFLGGQVRVPGVTEHGLALTWCQVEEDIVVKRVQWPMASRHTKLISRLVPLW